MAKIGIIGGSGLGDPKLIENPKETEVSTPYGKPSSHLVTGKIHGVDVVFIARHGKQHTIMPTNVNFRANIHALKDQGCTHIIAATACGSLREEIKPGDFVFVDQFIDMTKHRHLTFHDKDKVIHTPMADPFDMDLRTRLWSTADELGLPNHKKGTAITIEGPRFSTRAESHMFRSWGADIINMTTVPEVILANELGLKYAAVAMSTDYDCWKTDEEPVNYDTVLARMKENAENVKKLIIETIGKMK